MKVAQSFAKITARNAHLEMTSYSLYLYTYIKSLIYCRTKSSPKSSNQKKKCLKFNSSSDNDCSRSASKIQKCSEVKRSTQSPASSKPLKKKNFLKLISESSTDDASNVDREKAE